MKRLSLALPLCLLFSCADSFDPSTAEATNSIDGKEDALATSDRDCVDWCNARSEGSVEVGSCAIGDGSEEDCVAQCEYADPAAPAAGIQLCIEQAPLCYQTLQQCVAFRTQVVSCESWCEYRISEHADEGFCSPSLDPDGTCVDACLYEWNARIPETTDALEACIKDAPLCYRTLEDCTNAQ